VLQLVVARKSKMLRKCMAATAATVAMVSAFAQPAAGQDTPLAVTTTGNCSAFASSRVPPGRLGVNDAHFGDYYAAATATATGVGSCAYSGTVAELDAGTYLHSSETSLDANGEADCPTPTSPNAAGNHPNPVSAIVNHTTQFGVGSPPSGVSGVLANATVTISTSASGNAGGTGTAAASVGGQVTGAGMFNILFGNTWGTGANITGWYFNEGVGTTTVNTSASGISFGASLLIGWGDTIAFTNNVGNAGSGSAATPTGHAEHQIDATGTIAIQGLNQ